MSLAELKELKQRYEQIVAGTQNDSYCWTKAYVAALEAEFERLNSKLDRYAIEHPTICYTCGKECGPKEKV